MSDLWSTVLWPVIGEATPWVAILGAAWYLGRRDSQGR